MSAASLQDRFTEEDANLLFAFIPGNPDDPAFFREFLSTFQQVPGYPAPPPNADRKLPFYMQCDISLSLPKSKEEIEKVAVKGEATIPLGALLRAQQREQGGDFFLRKVGNEAFSAFRDTGMAPISNKMKCVCCGKAHTQSSKTVQAVVLGIASDGTSGNDAAQIAGLRLFVDPFYYVCSRPKCISQVMKAKELKPSKSRMRICYNCQKYEDPTKPMKTCSRCKAVFYCDSTCQKTHWKDHKTMCKEIAGKK